MQRHSTLVITIDSNSRFKHNGKDKIQRRVFILLLHSKLVLFHHWAPLICMRGALQIKLYWFETTKQQILTSEAKTFLKKYNNYNKNKCKTVERHTWGGISRCGEGAAGCALRLAVSLKDLPVRARSVWPGYSDIIMERSITAGHCCETSYSPKTQTSVTVSGFILLHRRVQTAFMTIFEWMFRKMSRCANVTLDRHRGGITLYYLATQSSPEEAEDRWRYGCCSRHHDPHSSPQRLLQPRFKKHVSTQIVTETGSRYLLDQNRWISGPGLCGRWVCPTGCCSWWCPPSLQRTSSPQRSSTAISWKAIWRHSEPGDGGFVYTFRQEKLKNDRLMFKAEDGERGLAVVSEDKRSLTLS